MVDIGKMNKLTVVKMVDFGLYLDGGERGEILLPQNAVPENVEEGDELDVFIYFDSEDRIIATTQEPFAMVGEFALLRCVDVSAVGAFLDWGLYKNVLVPFREQKMKMQVGRSYLVFLYVDEESDRIVASAKIDRFLDNEMPFFEPGDEVDIVVADLTDIGYKAIVNNAFWGVIYLNEVFEPLNKGEKMKAYVKKVREDDKIDLSIHRYGYRKVEDSLQRILDKIEQEGGEIQLSDKSSPEEIYDVFGISKKTFKQAIGALYKQRLIDISKDSIKRLRSHE
ncbi:MAG: S1-like domain-containing RNA-binding protein [Bacteroidales bacterium]|nr:S1-like domain-containing RNA-binding protein [Bacteroidales bacterium]MDY0215566.1 S1-like domain-containing RNA-binding protein [Bacteroidales bacterium]